MRVSLDHYSQELHDTERSEGSFAKTIEGIDWLAREGLQARACRPHLLGRERGAMRATATPR